MLDNKMYQMIADEKELEWFFDHAIFRPNIVEAYTAVFVSRHKKLTKEEQQTIGLTRAESEFLSVQTIRPPKVSEMGEDKPWEFKRFLRHIKRFNVDKGAYTTALDQPIPEKTLAIIFYINPCNNLKVWEDVRAKVDFAKDSIITATINSQGLESMYQQYQCFGNVEDHIKHARAKCKGSRYWMDFDVDVPDWFKTVNKTYRKKVDPDNNLLLLNEEEKIIIPIGYYAKMLEKLNNRFGKGNYIIVDTSGGYHILVRTHAIRSNPHDFCKEVEEIYKQGVIDGNPEYLDENGTCKFEAIVNDSQIPGIPLPGTFQYGRPVTVLNKEDFTDTDRNPGRTETDFDDLIELGKELEKENRLEKILRESNQGRTESDREEPLTVTL